MMTPLSSKSFFMLALTVLNPSCLSDRYDPDSGHDSGAEDSSDSPPPFSFLTMGMGKIYLPSSTNSHHTNANYRESGFTNGNGPSSPTGVTYPLPPRLGVCLDFEKGRVTFYDAHSLRPLWEGPVDCSAPVCPAFCFIGGGALQLQELVANRKANQTPVRRVTIQSRVTKLNWTLIDYHFYNSILETVVLIAPNINFCFFFLFVLRGLYCCTACWITDELLICWCHLYTQENYLKCIFTYIYTQKKICFPTYNQRPLCSNVGNVPQSFFILDSSHTADIVVI